jgi:DNA polymerase III subunit alpha
MAHLPEALQSAEQFHARKDAGQEDLFGMPRSRMAVPERRSCIRDPGGVGGRPAAAGGEGDPRPLPHRPPHRPLRTGTAAAGDQPHRRPGRRAAGDRRRGAQKVMIAGLAVAITRRKTQRGRMAGLLLDDRSGRIEATLFNEVLEAHQERLAADQGLCDQRRAAVRRIPRRPQPAGGSFDGVSAGAGALRPSPAAAPGQPGSG